MVGKGFNFSLMDQLVFYGSYHTKKANQLIHFIFVPVIMWSVGVWVSYAGPVPIDVDLPSHLSFLPAPVAEAYEFNWVLVGVALYTLYYTVLEPLAGLSWGIVVGIPVAGFATYFQHAVPHAWAWAIGAHVLGWFMQIQIGHIMVEHRKPALMDSFFQSLVLAGLFAWMEGLFALGYRPRLQEELNKRIQAAQAADESHAQPLLNNS